MKVTIPKTLAAWCTILFFAVFGINSFVAIPYSGVILGALAIGLAVAVLLSK